MQFPSPAWVILCHTNCVPVRSDALITLLWYCISCTITLISAWKFLIEMTRMILAASSWSGSSQYLLANTRQASAVSIYKTHRRLYSSVSIVLWQTIPLTMKNSSHSLFISSLLQIQYFNQWSGYNWPLLIRCIWIPISTCMFSLTPYFMTVMYNYLNKQEGRMRLDQSNMFIFMLYKFCQWTTGTILLSDKHLIVFQNWMILLLYS